MAQPSRPGEAGFEMEGNVDSEDGLMNMAEDISTVDFDLVADGVDWCDQCKKLKQVYKI